jgi:putative tryptophan/tyrosine transport system substrate-binding protein
MPRGRPKGAKSRKTLEREKAKKIAVARAELVKKSLLRRYRLPDIYPFRYYPADGGLASYGPDTAEQFKRAAEYVDRILKGAKPSELPVQAPTKYELVLNLKAPKAIGLEI